MKRGIADERYTPAYSLRNRHRCRRAPQLSDRPWLLLRRALMLTTTATMVAAAAVMAAATDESARSPFGEVLCGVYLEQRQSYVCATPAACALAPVRACVRKMRVSAAAAATTTAMMFTYVREITCDIVCAHTAIFACCFPFFFFFPLYSVLLFPSTTTTTVTSAWYEHTRL